MTYNLSTRIINPPVTITGEWNINKTNLTRPVIISGDVHLYGKTDCYSLTFEQGGHLTIEAGARLRVWEGGITNSDCTTVNYIKIYENHNTDSYGELLIHPDVTKNTIPKVDFIFITAPMGYKEINGSYIWNRDRWTPLVQQIASWTKIPNLPLYDHAWDYTNNGWKQITSLSQITPYNGNTLTCDTSEIQSIEITIPGLSNGNSNVNITFPSKGFHFFGNSYLGKINTGQFLDYITQIGCELYMRHNDNEDYVKISVENLSQYPYINPSRDFVVNKSGSLSYMTLNYKDLVWDPSFEPEVTPTRSSAKGGGSTPKSELPDDPIFKNPEPNFPEHEEEMTK